MYPITLNALVADALSLGPHWIYNQSKLAQLYPEGIHSFADPLSAYHPKRVAGQFTHHGDQTALLHASIQKRGGYTSEGWREDWVAGMRAYDGYCDGATKDTLKTDGLTPSGSNDLAGASRIAPIIDLGISPEETIAAARSQAALTHGDAGVIEAAEFFARAALALRDGATIVDALDSAARESDAPNLSPAEHVQVASGAAANSELDFLAQASDFGLACPLPEAFPLTLYFLLRPGATFASALSDNALAGGDSAARALLIGTLFAARGDQADDALIRQIEPALGVSS